MGMTERRSMIGWLDGKRHDGISIPSSFSQRSLIVRTAADAEVRVETFQGREHLVVPVILLMEGVIWPVNAETPELVLIEDVAASYLGWNGRPVVPDHPSDDEGNRITANTPSVAELNWFGFIFNAYIKDTALGGEAWLDIARAKELGGNAWSVVERAQANQPIEVSVGVYVGIEDKEGKFKGKAYKGIWREIIQDHLAMLPEGTIGACSNEMGCGAPRAATVHLVTAEGFEPMAKETATPPTPQPRSLKDRFLGMFKELREGAETSDRELRWKLYDALRAVEPGFYDVDYVYTDTTRVVYCVYLDEKFTQYRRDYTVDSSGQVSVGATREEVVPVQDWQVVGAQASAENSNDLKTAAGASGDDCGCKETKMAAKTDRVKTLIASKKNSFTDANQKFLESLSEEQLKMLEDQDAAAPEPKVEEPKQETPAPKVETPAPTAASSNTETMSEEDWWKKAPKSVRDAVTRVAEAEQSIKDDLVARLKDAQDGYSEAELKTLSIKDLQKVAKIAKIDEPVVASTSVIDFSARSAPRMSSAADRKIDAPPSLMESVRAARAKK